MRNHGEHANNDYLIATINQATAVADLGTLMVAQSGKRWETKAKWRTLFGATWPVIPGCVITVTSVGAITMTRDGNAMPITAANGIITLPECEDLSNIFLHSASDIDVLITFKKNETGLPSQT